MPSGHEADQGIPLAAADPAVESVTAGPACVRRRAGALVRRRRDRRRHHAEPLPRPRPAGPHVRARATTSRACAPRRRRTRRPAPGSGEPAVSIGLQGDAIQPLTLRVDQGECLRIRLHEPAQGRAGEHPPPRLEPARGRRAARRPSRPNPDAMAAPGATVEYEWMVAAERAGGHALLPQPRRRPRADEPRPVRRAHRRAGRRVAGIDPLTGGELRSGWDAVDQDATPARFREFALYYHEIGDENYQVLDRTARSCRRSIR